MKQIHFVSGLPRSCSTLLCNILAQHPNVHATGSSPLHEIGYIARNVFQCEEAKSMQPEDMESLYLNYVLGGMQNAYNQLTDRPIVADKNRSWIGHLDQLFKIIPNAKVLVPVRDVRSILSSLEKIRRKHPSALSSIEIQSAQNWTTIERRVQGWLQSPPLGIALERVYEASQRFKDKLHFVNADNLTSDPEGTMQKVWNYLELDYPNHDFNNVEQYTREHEMGWPYGDHSIRSKIVALEKDYHDILGKQLSNTVRDKFTWVYDL